MIEIKAILVGVTTILDKYDIDYSLDELENLANTLDIEVVFKIKQKLDTPNTKTYIGSGKLNEIIIAINTYSADMVIFNDELTPSQLRNNQDKLNVEVIDRSYLILKIFELRAQTKESKLEIKLAKDMYLLPRISFLREKESRIGGTSGAMSSKGAGETQKELDKRHLMAEIVHIQKELDQIRKMKQSQIEKRKKNDIPIVALVGYTNAGKSSTMNTILEYINETNKSVLAKDQLFATLSTYNRKVTIEKTDFILVDTIGFVSKLPHNLINSFYQTLQEIKNADFIIHVLDSSSQYINEQLNVVYDVLKTLNANSIPTLYLLNKWDKNEKIGIDIMGQKSLPFSNKTKLNIKELINNILEEISPSTIHVKLLLPYKEGALANILESKAKIYNKSYENYGMIYDVELPSKLYSKFHEYDMDSLIS
ncbi:MAG: GTPase HflX [Anaeroplasma sp.]|nr:GTPase HflX [Anaeroplasma sp.]